MIMLRFTLICLLVVSSLVYAEDPEAISLLGKPLFPPALSDDVMNQFEANLAVARAEFEKNPADPEALIWLGRRTAYPGRYKEAIAIYTRGVEKYPENPKFLRHRGHRYLTIREIDKAIGDFEKAVLLIEGKPDEIEPDGLPNAKNIPTSTLKTNIWYHLGLAYYLRGDFEQAERAYRECLKHSKNDDMLTATTHWYYMTLMRQGKKEEAQSLLEPIKAEMNIIEDFDYHSLVLMYKGLKTSDSILNPDQIKDLSGATIAYGVGNRYIYTGEKDKGLALFRRIIETNEWAAFGYLAAEADLARSSK